MLRYGQVAFTVVLVLKFDTAFGVLLGGSGLATSFGTYDQRCAKGFQFFF